LWDAISSLLYDIIKCDVYADSEELKRQRDRVSLSFIHING
jgi:hypothetical protein